MASEREKRLEEALRHAVNVILNYQLDLRNSDGVCGVKGSLAGAGFCQGTIYRYALRDINRRAGEVIYPEG